MATDTKAIDSVGEPASKDEPVIGDKIKKNQLLRNPIRDILGVQAPEDSIEFAKILAYAMPGVGKTYFCGTACDHEATFPALLLDVDGGAMTLRNKNLLDVVQVRNMDQVEKVCNELHKANDIYYKTVMIDSLTFLQKKDMTECMKYAQRKNGNRFPEPKFELYVASPKEWGMSNERMRMIIQAYKDLPCHLICTALERKVKDAEGRVIGYEPELGGGNLRDNLPGYFDIVGRMTARKQPGQETERMMQVVMTTKVVAKDRSQVLGDSVENPSIPKMWELMQASPLVASAA